MRQKKTLKKPLRPCFCHQHAIQFQILKHFSKHSFFILRRKRKKLKLKKSNYIIIINHNYNNQFKRIYENVSFWQCFFFSFIAERNLSEDEHK